MTEIELPQLIFILIFSMGIALFHTVVISAFYNLKFPDWLFFVINPSLLILSYIIYKPSVFYMLIGLFASVFILTIIGFILKWIQATIASIKKSRKKNKSWLKIIGGLLFVAIMFILFMVFNFYFIAALFLFVIISSIVKNGSDPFYRYQGILPTSKIRSMAMGLVELQGVVDSDAYLISPLSKAKCIGYRYKIERRESDSEGRDSYTTIEDFYECNDFNIQDTTGQVKVSHEKLRFYMLKLSEQKYGNSKRYSEYLIKPKQEVLLVGKAMYKSGGEVQIEYEENKKVFGIIPIEGITFFNKYKPLKERFFITTGVIAFFIALALITPIKIENNKLIIEKPSIFKTAKDSNSFYKEENN